MAMRSGGLLSTIVMRPAPTRRLPAHSYTAPRPAAAPAYVCFMAGSSAAHGLHAVQLRKSLTWAKTAAADAEMHPDRVTRNSEGIVFLLAYRSFGSPANRHPTESYLTWRMAVDSGAVVEALYRADWGLIQATLIRLVRDFDLAEEAAQEAFAAAVEHWRANG